MMSEKTDWKVRAVLDRAALVEEIARLARILARQRVAVIVSAESEEEAVFEARVHLQRHAGISAAFLADLRARRLPT